MKRLAYLACIAIIMAFTGCSKDDEEPVDFPKGVKETLNVLKGSFTGEEYFLEQLVRTDNLTFAPFDKPIDKPCMSIGTGDEYNMKYGTVHRTQDSAVGGEKVSDYYFYIDPVWGTLVLCEYNFEEDYSTGVRETLDFEVIDNDHIKIERIIYSRQ